MTRVLHLSASTPWRCDPVERTLIVSRGRVTVLLPEGEEFVALALGPGDVLRIPSGVEHQILAEERVPGEPSVVVECTYGEAAK